MPRCFIYAAGTFYGLRERPRPGDLQIAADAGLLLCQQEGLRPDLVIGDFDSMELEGTPEGCVRVPVEKDDTDTMLAIREGLKRGCTEFHLYGGTGGARLDHTLANFQALLYLRRSGARGWLYGDDFCWTAVENETLTLRRQVDWGLVSVFPMAGEARGVDETGLQYPLENAALRPEVAVGVSNHFAADEAAVTVRDGALLVGWELPRKDA